MPANEEVEREVLGQILIGGSNVFDRVSSVLSPRHFSLSSHRRVFTTIVTLADSGQPFDVLTIANLLGKDIDTSYLASLTDNRYARADLRHYVELLEDAAKQRELLQACDAISSRIQNGEGTADEQLEYASQRLSGISGTSKGIIRTFQDVPDVYEYSSTINWFVDGLIPQGSVVLLASDAGVGKTWLALELARAATLTYRFLGRRVFGMPVLYCDRENPLPLIRSRLDLMFGGSIPGLKFWGMWADEEPPLITDPRYRRIAEQMRGLIIIDTFSAFHQAKENESSEMAPKMAAIRAIAAAGGTVLLLHHRAKAEGSFYRGSSAIPAAVDIALRLSAEDGFLSLESFKNRFGAAFRFTIRPDFTVGSFEVVDSVASTKRQQEYELISAEIGANPGITQADLVRAVGMNKARVLDLLEQGVGHNWRWELGKQNRKHYYPLQSCSGDSEQFLEVETSKQSCSAVPGLIDRNRNRSVRSEGVAQ